MGYKPMALKLLASRAVLKQLDLENLEEEQLKQLEESLPKTIVKEMAPLVYLKPGNFRVRRMSEMLVRSDGGQLTDHWWMVDEARAMAYGWGDYGFGNTFDQPQVGEEVEAHWEDVDGQKVWRMYNQVGGEVFTLGILLWGLYPSGYGFYEEGKMVMTMWGRWSGEPPRLEKVYKVHMVSREKLVVEVEDFPIFYLDEEEVTTTEIKVTIIMELDRIE